MALPSGFVLEVREEDKDMSNTEYTDSILQECVKIKVASQGTRTFRRKGTKLREQRESSERGCLNTSRCRLTSRSVQAGCRA
jgi:hypothetical protein